MEFRKFIILTFLFILFTPIGTVSHEYGHIAVAKFLGYKTTLHYASMNWYPDTLKSNIVVYKIDEANREQLNEFIITCGGVLQTILTGTIGFIFLLMQRRKIINSGLKLYNWFAVFLSLFWLRQILNPIFTISNELKNPDGYYFGGDEFKISNYLGLWEGTISSILGIIALLITGYVAFYIISIKNRLTFALSGFIGSALGFVLWMIIIGPKLLP